MTAGGAVQVEVVGDVDLTTAGQLQARLQDAGRSPLRTVVVDLSRVVFIDCHGLGVLLTARAQIGPRMVLGALAPAVTSLLELTGTGHHFATPTRPAPTSAATSSPVASGGLLHE